jgi:hypothetical protein
MYSKKKKKERRRLHHLSTLKTPSSQLTEQFIMEHQWWPALGGTCPFNEMKLQALNNLMQINPEERD